MVNWGGDFSFYQAIDIRIDTRIDIRITISISTISMTTKFRKRVHLEELTQTRLIKEMASSRQYSRDKLETCVYYHSVYGDQTKTIISPLPQRLWQPTWQDDD